MFGIKFKEIKETKSAVQEGMTLPQVRVAMLQLMAEENTNHYRMGQLYNYVVDNQLAEKAGYKNALDYFSRELSDLSPASLRMYAAVAEDFTEAISVRFGVTCLYLLVNYKEAAAVEVNHEEPGGTVIEVPGENGAVTSKLFSACSVEEMRKALQRKRKPASSKPLPEADLALTDQYREAVTGRFPKGVRVRVQLRNEKGKAVLDFKGIPVAEVRKLGESLMAELPAVREARGVDKAPPGA
jgi:hypothetical protein